MSRCGATAINNRHTLLPALVTVVPLAVAVVMADLGTAVVLVVTAAVVFFVAGLEKRTYGSALIVAVVCVGAADRLQAVPHRARVRLLRSRIQDAGRSSSWGEKVKSYMRQSSFNRDPGYHVRQSKIAVGSGGLIGDGLMHGKQKLFYLPEAHTDFIYAVVGEELGLVGCGALVILVPCHSVAGAAVWRARLRTISAATWRWG